MKKLKKVDQSDPLTEISDQYVDYAALGRQIRRMRGLKEFTQESMGEKIGISASFCGHIERGTRKASVETLVRIAHALNCGLDELLMDSLPQRELERSEVERMFFDFARKIGLFGMRDMYHLQKTEVQETINGNG